MAERNKDRIRALLKSIETGEPGPIAVVDQARYIQHNPQTHEGSEGLEALFKRLSLTEPRVRVVRAFEDGDFVFAHTEYDFSRSNVGFEVFRFENGRAVEHWDNIQPRQGPNPAGRTMTDGPTEADPTADSEATRTMVRRFTEDVLIGQRPDLLDHFIDDGRFAQHAPDLGDGLAPLRARMSQAGDDWRYERLHRVLAEGDFALAASEGVSGGRQTAFYDLYRVADGRIVEHWNTVEAIPARSAWKNDNGKF